MAARPRSSNEASSRSHAVLQIALTQPSRPGLSSQLSLIDLAGSERVHRADIAGRGGSGQPARRHLPAAAE